MKFKAIAAIALLGIASPCFAASDLDNIGSLTQSEFKSLSEDMSAVVSYKPVGPAEPLGILGFDVGLEVTGTELNNVAIWDKATLGSDSVPDTLLVPKLHAVLGLPLNFNVGAVYSKVPSTNVSLLGGEINYAFMAGSTVAPAVSVRGTLSKLSGVDELDMSTKGLELEISKGFAMFTPYAGIGEVWVDSKPQGAAVTVGNLKDESYQQNKYYLGVNMNFVFLNVDLDYDNTGSTNSYTLKLGWRF